MAEFSTVNLALKRQENWFGDSEAIRQARIGVTSDASPDSRTKNHKNG
jgi:hypothetical protein